MGSTLIVNRFFIVIVIYTIVLHRPVSCRRTVSASYLERTDLRVLQKCYRKCRFFQSRLRNVPQFKMPYGKNCFSRCVHRQVEKDKPPENILVPSRILQLPKELYKSIDRRQWQHGDCDAFDSEKKIDLNMRKAVILDGVVITCVNKNELLVSWKQPNGLSNCTGYQVNYRLGRRGKSGRFSCFEVSKDKTDLLINKEKGFHGQEEIHLAVTALPLPLKCDIKLQKYKLCPGRKRIRRNIHRTPSTPPTDMPFEIPDPPPGLIDQASMYSAGSDCRPPNATSTAYAGNVKVFDVRCIHPGKHSKKAFVVHWGQPENYLSVPFTHYQVKYLVFPNDVIPNPTRVKCREFEKTVQSCKIENVELTDVLHVLVVPYPTYSTRDVKVQRFTPCLPTEPPPTRPKSTQPSTPPSTPPSTSPSTSPSTPPSTSPSTSPSTPQSAPPSTPPLTPPLTPQSARQAAPPSEPVRMDVVLSTSLTILVAFAILTLLYVYHRRRSRWLSILRMQSGSQIMSHSEESRRALAERTEDQDREQNEEEEVCKCPFTSYPLTKDYGDIDKEDDDRKEIFKESRDIPLEDTLVPSRISQLPDELYRIIDRGQRQHGDTDDVNEDDLKELPKEDEAKIYVSYYADSGNYHFSLLNLVAKLRSVYSVNLLMDSYYQTGVNELGPARWYQLQLSKSTRVLMVISKEYLKICRKWQSGQTDILQSDDINVKRVFSELQYVCNHIFDQGKNSLLTIVLADDVNQRELPDLFRGMKTFAWPENEDQEHAIVCSICSQEPLVAC